jgi:hypothetical protein
MIPIWRKWNKISKKIWRTCLSILAKKTVITTSRDHKCRRNEVKARMKRVRIQRRTLRRRIMSQLII